MPVPPALLHDWLAARSLSRGQPAPVPDCGGLRVDMGLPEERRRYVFADAEPGLVLLGREIDEPFVTLKLCDTSDALAALLPPRWGMQPQNWVMLGPGTSPAATLPPGYRLERSAAGAVTSVRILDSAGAQAAQGFAAEAGGAFVYDRIVTDPAHQRRGLGRVVMAVLGQAKRDPAGQDMLVATDEGRALYEALGWRVISPYTTALIPPPGSGSPPPPKP